ncbi:DUF418 domain-containing protein [Nocardia sp. NBC_00508]|uniref:DUF418 domain-containing protein n=1 Tax=Nocardia sp. NBC_00508 TaxID=2975992 RepID=UPI002E80A11B|nr:DUF418 domain-containing protein [Nocardia sp. NBC_00508]WUD66167.1 DUF418 domain-containing protein [Nocardia sp. NBC_00508]
MPRPIESVSAVGATTQRVVTLDVARGFALFGILITNAAVLTGILSSDGPTTPMRLWTHAGPVDRVTDAVVEALFQGRFYLLFAFLFGYSFTLQMEAARRAGASGSMRMLRRCCALFLIGAAHALLLWVGDILTLYAMLGLILLLLRGIRPSVAVGAGVVLFVAFSLLAFLPEGATDWSTWLLLPEMRSGYAGGALDTLAVQLDVAPRFVRMTWLGQGATSLALFLLGMAAGKNGLLQDAERVRRWTPFVLYVGFGVGLPVSAVTFTDVAGIGSAPANWSGVQQLVNPLMTFAYLALVIRLAQTPRCAAAIGWLAPIGRMSASHYIAQSVVLMVLYSGYGPALAGRVPAPVVIALGVLTFGSLGVASRWWLARHAYGPVEWCLRAATYARIPQWKRDSPPYGQRPAFDEERADFSQDRNESV